MERETILQVQRLLSPLALHQSYRFLFFFQAEDGIRDVAVTGVQTCALPISVATRRRAGGASTSGRGRERLMKAAVYYETGAPDVFRYEDVPDPECYPGGVLIDVEAISIEGGDTLNRAGGGMTSKPHIVGYQCPGTNPQGREGGEDRQEGQKVVGTMMSGSDAAL